MNGAVDTAMRLLVWAVKPDGVPPNGSLWKSALLATPGEPVLAALRELARTRAALLGAGNPAFGDRSPVGLGPVLLAAAIGGRSQADPAAGLASAVPQPRGWHDAVARHALVQPAVRALPKDALVELLIAASPLTSVLHRPPLARTTVDAEQLMVRMLQLPHGRRVLVTGLATCSADPQVLTWRAQILDQWVRHGRHTLAMDVYTTARLRFAQRWDRQVRTAWAWQGRPDPLMTATAAYWAPADRLGLGRERPLVRGHEEALALVRRYRTLIGGSR